MIELMIAMALSLLLASGIVAVFVNNSYSFNQDDNTARMQDDARHALREIALDISMAGHFAELFFPQLVVQDTSLSIAVDCGPPGVPEWVYQTAESGSDNSLSITSIDNATGAMASGAHSCISAGEFQDGTDVVSIKRVAGAEAGTLESDRAYLRTNGTAGLLYRAPMTATPVLTIPAPFADWEYRPRVYYIRRYANTPDDNIPTLCRKVLDVPGPSMTTECLAEGIENLQIEYGIDSSGDGYPNMYTSNPTLDEIQGVVTARIALLARTTEIDTRYTNDKIYQVGNAPSFSPGDSFHRRVFSTTVTIQNIRSMNILEI